MFLQLHGLSARARTPARTPPAGEPRDALAARVDQELAAFRERRRELAKGLDRLRVIVDDVVRTDATEHIDDPSFPPEAKLRLVRRLHDLNVRIFAYQRFLRALLPVIRESATASQRVPRVLELASGSGELAFALEKESQARGLDLELTGSDYQPAYVDSANDASRQRGSRVVFRRIDAFEMDEIESDAFDVVLVAQSLHHFSAGGLARMLIESRRVARYAFVGIDVRRSLSLFPFGLGVATLMDVPGFVHDSVLTMRKLYSEPELAFVAERALSTSRVDVRSLHPGYSMLTVRFS